MATLISSSRALVVSNTLHSPELDPAPYTEMEDWLEAHNVPLNRIHSLHSPFKFIIISFEDDDLAVHFMLKFSQQYGMRVCDESVLKAFHQLKMALQPVLKTSIT